MDKAWKTKSRFSEEDMQTLRALYDDGVGLREIARQLARSYAAIQGKVTTSGFANRRGGGGKGTGDQHYFDVIDTPLKAYLIGFLLADGYISIRKHRASVGVEVHERDKEIIELLVETLGGRSCYRASRKSWIYTIHGKRICDSLAQYSIIPRKSHSVSIQNIPRELEKYAVLGYSDGDGNIFFTHGAIGWRIKCGSRKILEDIRKIILRDTGIGLSKLSVYNHTQNLKVHGNIKARGVLDWLYNDNDMGLSRKRRFYEFRVEER